MAVVQTKCSTCEHAPGGREENPIVRINAVYILDVLQTSGREVPV